MHANSILPVGKWTKHTYENGVVIFTFNKGQEGDMLHFVAKVGVDQTYISWYKGEQAPDEVFEFMHKTFGPKNVACVEEEYYGRPAFG